MAPGIVFSISHHPSIEVDMGFAEDSGVLPIYN